MAITTRTLTNYTEGPLQYPNGGIVPDNTEIWFELVDADHEPCFAIDATTGEMVLSPASCLTTTGIFTVALWPNDRGTTSLYRMSIPTIPEFGYIFSYVPTGTGNMLLSEFVALAESGTTWTELPGYLVPPGGLTDQVLAKISDADGDTAWIDTPALDMAQMAGWPFDFYTSNLETVVAAIGTRIETIVITSPQTLGNSLIIPANVSIEIKQGGIITVPTGKILTVNGSFDAGMYQCFDGPGTVVLTKAREVYPEWWGAIGDGATDCTSALLSAITSLRKDVVEIAGTINGAHTLCYRSGTVQFVTGTYILSYDQLLISNDFGLTIEGKGAKLASNFQHGATTLLFTGTSSGYGIKQYFNGGRNLTFRNISICYDTTGFTGDLLFSYRSPGLKMENCFIGTIGVVSADRSQTAHALVRIVGDEFVELSNCTLDGAQYGVYMYNTYDAGPPAVGDAFPGSCTTLKNCTFYDFSISHIYRDPNSYGTKISFNIDSCWFNPIQVAPATAISVYGVDPLNINNCLFQPSVLDGSATVEWITITNCVANISGNHVGTGAQGITIDNTSVVTLQGNKFSLTTDKDAIILKGGVVSSSGNKFISCNKAYSIHPNGTKVLRLDLGLDYFTSTVSYSYYEERDTVLVSGHISYAEAFDISTNKFYKQTSRITLSCADEKFQTDTGNLELLKTWSGRKFIATSNADPQTFTMPATESGLLFSGLSFRIAHTGNQALTITGGIFYVGNSAATTSISIAQPANTGQEIELMGYGESGWQVADISGLWLNTEGVAIGGGNVSIDATQTLTNKTLTTPVIDILSTYADNTAASSLSTGTVYRTSTGVLMIKY